jgi:hypothetical protein
MSLEQPHGPLQRTEKPGLDFRAALFAAVVSGVLGTVCVSLSVRVAGLYGLTLFVGLPVIVGAVASLVYSYKVSLTSSWQAAKLSVVVGSVLCGGLLLLGSEGALCILMALPLALPLAMFGGIAGYALLRAMTRHRSAFAAPLLLCCSFPLGLGVEWGRKSEPPLRSVTTEIEMSGSPQQVWDTLIAFAPITTPPQGWFRFGIAYPIGAKIVGRGVGAVRYCQFSTGSFVEPITLWDESRLLAFDVTETPVPMRELSFYANLDPPHLHGIFQSRKGEFRLIALPHGNVRLVGTTWYQHDLWPAAYWGPISDRLIHQIHQRVLSHIQGQVENSRKGQST